MAEEVTISRLGAQGDGIADTPAGVVFVPGALPGERWRVAGPSEPAVRLCDSPDRQAPACRHFGTCGGCAAQHMRPQLYRAWKQGAVAEAFAHRGIAAEVRPIEVMPLASRRRAVMGVARRADGRVEIGFREAGRHRLVDLDECPVLMRCIVDVLPGLRELAGMAMPKGDGGRLVVTATETGLDVALSTGSIQLLPEVRAQLAAAAARLRLARLAVEGETIAELARPRVTLGGVAVEPANGTFMQAVAEAQARLTALVVDGIDKARRVADLFCGMGTFTFALARRAEVTAVDGDKAALSTLSAAAKSAQGLKRIAVKRRDLFREPLSPQELAPFDALVLDPPRAGAKAQCEAIARAKVGRVVMVSCNPATLARDCHTLIQAGFSMGPVIPVDQFVFSPHIEALTVLKR